MRGEVFKNALRTYWRSALYWAISMSVYGAYVVFLIPDPEGLQGYVRLMEAMPPAFLKAFGVADVAMFATAEGFLGFAFFTYGVILLSIYAVTAGLNVTANDEESGVMNLVASLPLARWQIVVERIAAQVLLLILVIFGSWLGIALATRVNPAVATMNMTSMLLACVGFLPVVLMVMGVTLLLGVVIRRRNVAAALAGLFVAASFILNSLGGVAGPGTGDLLKSVSVFSYFDGTSAALYGLDFVPLLVLFIIAAALAAASVGLFLRRDISA